MGSWRPAETGATSAPVSTEKPGGKEEPRDLLSARYLLQSGRLRGQGQRGFSRNSTATLLHQRGASVEASFILGRQVRGNQHGIHLNLYHNRAMQS